MVKSQFSKPDSGHVRDRLYERYRFYLKTDNTEDEKRKCAPYIRNLLSKYFPVDRNVRILDLGCGSGTLLYFLREAGYANIFGIDNSLEQIENARRLGFVEVSHTDVFSFFQTTTTESYDVVVAFDIIEHLTKSELFKLADEIYRILKPAGLWIIHAPNAEGVFGSRVRYADLTHEQAFTRESIEQLTRAAGFRTTKCFEDVPVIHGIKSMVRFFIWKSVRALLRIYFMAETGDTGKQAVFSQNLLALAQK